MKIELKIKSDLYKDSKPVKKNIITKIYPDIDDIFNPEEVVNTKGNVAKGVCQVFIKERGAVLLAHSYRYICDLLNAPYEVTRIGFKIKSDGRD